MSNERLLASMSAEDTAGFLAGRNEPRMSIEDPDLKRRFEEQWRLLREAMIDAAEVFAKALDEHSKESARVIREYAARAKEGDPRAAEQVWGLISQYLNEAWVPIREETYKELT